MKNFLLEKDGEQILVNENGQCITGCVFPAHHIHDIKQYRIIEEYDDLEIGSNEEPHWLDGV